MISRWRAIRLSHSEMNRSAWVKCSRAVIAPNPPVPSGLTAVPAGFFTFSQSGEWLEQEGESFRLEAIPSGRDPACCARSRESQQDVTAPRTNESRPPWSRGVVKSDRDQQCDPSNQYVAENGHCE